MNGNGVPGVPETTWKSAPRVRIGVAQDWAGEAILRVCKTELPPAALRVAMFMIHYTERQSRLVEKVRVWWIAEQLAMARETVSRALNLLAKLGLIGWKGGRARAWSWFALSPELLEEEPLPTFRDDRRSHSNVTAVVTPDIEIQDVEEDKREESPLATHVLPDTVGTDEEEHRWDAEYATSQTMEKLFHGKHCPERVKEGILRRFLDVRTGSVPSVLAVILSARQGARHIAYPFSYAMTCIGRAEEEAGLLPPMPAVA